MKVLVTGGAGYIGSETVAKLVAADHEVVVLDSFEHGRRQAVVAGATVVEGRIDDHDLVQQLLHQHAFDGVIHFAAYIQVGESVADPFKYFSNNVQASLKLFEQLHQANIHHVVFSSSAAVYGNPVRVPIEEDDPKQPTSPYGQSKLMVEQILSWLDQAYGLTSVSLRYFNASGAALDGSRGEAHQPESHLLPLLFAAALGQRDGIKIFGQDYATADGTCERDYIHIADLASAHLLALEYLVDGGATQALNVGTGQGYTNRQVVEMVQQITGSQFGIEYVDRRPGDPDQLIASPHRLEKLLGWQAEQSDLKTIIETAWKWHQLHPQGYAEDEEQTA